MSADVTNSRPRIVVGVDGSPSSRAALRWAIGCVTASDSSRLAALPRLRWRVASAPVVAGSLLLLIAMALQGHASDEASLPASDETSCAHRPSEAGAGCVLCRSKSADRFGRKSADTPGVAAHAPLAVAKQG